MQRDSEILLSSITDFLPHNVRLMQLSLNDLELLWHNYIGPRFW